MQVLLLPYRPVVTCFQSHGCRQRPLHRNLGSQAGIRVSSPHQRTETLSQSRSSSNNNVHSIVAKWNISYSGKRDSSAEEFLKRVEECRRGSSLTDEDLFRALPFLLKPPAQYWFRFNSTKWESWAEFVAAFKRRYGGINFQTRVRDEGRRRTQGPEEPIADYLLNIRLIFQHYDPPISEYEQLQLAINNLHPSYLGALLKLDYRSFDEFEEAGERFKASKEIGKSYLPPPPVKDSVLPEYSYRASKSSFDKVAATETEPSSSDNAKGTDKKINSESNNRTKKKTKNRGKNNGNKSGKPTSQTSTISTENSTNQCAGVNPPEAPQLTMPNPFGFYPPFWPPYGLCPGFPQASSTPANFSDSLIQARAVPTWVSQPLRNLAFC